MCVYLDRYRGPRKIYMHQLILGMLCLSTQPLGLGNTASTNAKEAIHFQWTIGLGDPKKNSFSDLGIWRFAWGN